jgi:putative cell wall-binding protein
MKICESLFLCSVILLGSASGSFAQDSHTAITVDSKLDNDLIRLGGQMMIAGQAYEYDRHLADDIGPRLTGSAM